jgi:glutamine amidotransferase
MTALFGCICNQPQALGTALEPVRTVLVHGEPVVRWGLGYVQSGEVLLSRHPRGAHGGVDFYEGIRQVQSDYIIGAAVLADDGRKGNANTQPFRFRSWLFAQEGEIPRFPEIQDKLREHVPDYLQRNIKGQLSAEYVFHLFLSMLHDAQTLDDFNLDIHDARRALRDTLAFVYSVMAQNGVEGRLGNLVCTNGRSMLAVRLGPRPLFIRRLKEQADPKLPESEFKAVLIVSAEENPGEGFEDLPDRAVVAVRRDVTTDVVDLDG